MCLCSNTERPETIAAGGNILYAGNDTEELNRIVDIMLAKPRDWNCPFGDGATAGRVLDILHKYL
ncbi:hypothetical protein IPH19_04930 [Candidatus Uhrbacteria bacterium]|nr:MAG: hypothetical protein IPH19_04930 [Candidatus Uhrbacteria bacterium]